MYHLTFASWKIRVRGDPIAIPPDSSHYDFSDCFNLVQDQNNHTRADVGRAQGLIDMVIAHVTVLASLPLNQTKGNFELETNPLCIQRLWLCPMRYDYRIFHNPGTMMFIADGLLCAKYPDFMEW